MKRFSDRIDGLRQSDIRALTQMVNAVDGINLGQGICDLPTPEPIKRAAQKAIEEDRSIYSNYAGIRPLRESILEKVRTFNQIPATTSEQVMVSAGSTGAFVAAVFALLDHGDEAILFEPFYGYHQNIIRLTGATCRFVSVSPKDGHIPFQSLESAINDRSKVIVLNTPTNPSGKVWPREEIERLYRIASNHDLIVITDEIYEYMTYDDHVHVSPASLPGAFDRTITISGFSKSHNMTGWRLGYAVGPSALIERMGLLNDLFYICAPTPLQYGVVEAADSGDDYVADLRKAYAERRELLCSTLEEIGFEFHWPQGAYYVLADFSKLRDRFDGFGDDREAAETLITRAGVASIPVNSFFANPDDVKYLLRFCFAKEIHILKAACRQLREAFAQ